MGGGERQRDPLSPLLLILRLEVMVCSIGQNDQIQAIKIKNEEVKLSLFANGMTCFLRTKSSYGHLSISI